MTLNIPIEFARAFEGVDPDTERKCMSFLADVRSQYNEMRDQLDEREYDNEQPGKKISQLRELLARVRDELGKQISLLSPDARNAIDNELGRRLRDRPTHSPTKATWRGADQTNAG